jgi:hypothetical protein
VKKIQPTLGSGFKCGALGPTGAMGATKEAACLGPHFDEARQSS